MLKSDSTVKTSWIFTRSDIYYLPCIGSQIIHEGKCVAHEKQNEMIDLAVSSSLFCCGTELLPYQNEH